MECRQCGAGLSPAMVESGACGFCGTVVAEIAPRKHVEKVVDEKVDAVRDQLRRDLQADLDRQRKADRRAAKHAEPSAVAVAAAEAGKYTAAKVWGCGAGCLSTAGSVAMFLVIFGFVGFMNLLPHIDQILERFGVGNKTPVEQPAAHPKKPKRPR